MGDSRTTKRLLGSSALAIVLLSLMGLQYLFRSEVVENPEIGKLIYKYRWGRPYEIIGDINGDGTEDYRERIEAPFGPVSTHTGVLLEFWEDVDFDGSYEYHGTLKHGVINSVEIDLNDDGRYEKVLLGEEATRFLDGRTRSPNLAQPTGTRPH